MSSVYRILCLSHDPATSAEEYCTPEAAAKAIASGVDGHRRCDLLIGRYSYPLVEVGCPPTAARGGPPLCYAHRDIVWVDSAWLRALCVVHQLDDEPARALVRDPQLRCWSWERLLRLRDELGITIIT